MYGKYRSVAKYGAAAATTVSPQPPEGVEWAVLRAWGWHDDNVGGPYNCYWILESLWPGAPYDSYTFDVVSLANSEQLFFGAAAKNTAVNWAPQDAYIINKYQYLTFGAAAMGAGKKLLATLLVIERNLNLDIFTQKLIFGEAFPLKVDPGRP